MTRTRDLWRRARRAGLLRLLIMVLAVFSFRSAVADWNDVPTGSMKPTILIGDRIVVNKLAYDLKIPFTRVRLATWADPEPGDIVVCWSPANGDRLVKRVVGVPGDVVAMRDGRLVINGRPLRYERAGDPAVAESLGEDARGKVFYTEDLGDVRHVVAFEPARTARRDFGPLTVPEGRYLVLGDNRDNSADSRYFGFVERAAIAGRVPGLAVSLDYEHGYRPRWSRFCRALI